MVVIEAMRDEGNYLGPAAAVLNDCKELAGEYVIATFIHRPRESNQVAGEY
jgi:hypothetical protein